MVTYTSSSTYWAPLKPRIRIYAFSDTTYSSALYTYDAFTDVGVDTKPIALNFDSETTNVGSFSIEIEDKDSELDPDTFTRGNRVFIECSKDGSTWQPAFKGLVRGVDQNIYATSGRNITLNGYSYLVRLNERVLNTIKESSLTGDDYNRTDSTMFTNNLINNLLTTDSHYVYSNDDTQLYSIFKTANITGSPITEWIPRLDAQLVTVNDAINSILEFSNGLVMLNTSDDQLMLYTSDLITSATGIFLLTNQMNQNADDADYTMYPLEPYQYNISYDYADSGSRLIGSIGGAGGEPCPEIVNEDPNSDVGSPNGTYMIISGNDRVELACVFKATQTNCSNLRVRGGNTFNMSAQNTMQAKVHPNGATPTTGSQIGSTMNLYRERDPANFFREYSAHYYMGIEKGLTGVTGLTIGTLYWMIFTPPTGMNDTGQRMELNGPSSENYAYAYRGLSPSTGWTVTAGSGPLPRYDMDFDSGVLQEECGGGSSQATIDADPVFAIAHDRNMSSRLGVVERVISNIPTHIKTAQTLNEYLYNKLYYAAKPRFTFDFPSVSMCNKLPKAGDIVAHVDSMTNTGVRDGPIQTGVISSVQYSFEQGKGHDDALGLRRLSLSTTGIKRGSY